MLEMVKINSETSFNGDFPFYSNVSVVLPDEFGMVKNAEEQYLRDIGYKRHAFNVLVSSKIGLIRDVPDTRNKLYVQQSRKNRYTIKSFEPK